MVANPKRRRKYNVTTKITPKQIAKLLAQFPSLFGAKDLEQIRKSVKQIRLPRKRRGPRDPSHQYIRAARRLFEVRVPLGKNREPRLSLGQFHDRGSARRAVRLFFVLRSLFPDPYLARDELARQLCRPQPLPRWVRRCCLRCRFDAVRHCRCRRLRVQPVYGYIACVRAPGAKAVLGPFAEPARANLAARQHLVNVLGDRAAAYLPLPSEETSLRS